VLYGGKQRWCAAIRREKQKNKRRDVPSLVAVVVWCIVTGIRTKGDMSPSEARKRKKKARDVPSLPVLVRRCRLEEGSIRVERQIGVGGQGEARAQ